MTWEIFLGIAALIAFLAPILKLVSNNTEALTHLKDTCDNINKDNQKQDTEIGKLENKVNNHETRITVLEEKEK